MEAKRPEPESVIDRNDPKHPDNHKLYPQLEAYIKQCWKDGIKPDAREIIKYLK